MTILEGSFGVDPYCATCKGTGRIGLIFGCRGLGFFARPCAACARGHISQGSAYGEEQTLANSTGHTSRGSSLILFTTGEEKLVVKIRGAGPKQALELFHDAPPDLQSNRIVTKAACARNGFCLSIASEVLKADQDIVTTACARDGMSLQFASDTMKANVDVVMCAISQNAEAFSLVPVDLQNYKGFAITACTQNGRCLEYVSDALRADGFVVLAAAATYPKAFMLASPDLRNDSAFVFAAAAKLVADECSAHAPKELFSVKSVMIDVCSTNGLFLRVASDAIQADRDVVDAAIANNPESFQYASLQIRQDKSLAIAVCERDGRCLRFAANAARADLNVVMAAVMENASAFSHATPELRSDRFTALVMISVNSRCFQYLPDALKADMEVVMAACEKDGGNLEFVSQSMSADPDVLRCAFLSMGIKFSPDVPHTECAIVQHAVAQDSKMLKFASDKAQKYIKASHSPQ